LLTPVYSTPQVIDKTKGQIECLALNIYYEARGESRKGRAAVGHVTMNRVEHRAYPNDVCSVVYQKWKSTCQFSWVCSKNLPRIRQEIYEDIYKQAETIYHREKDTVTRGATHFHSTYVQPSWAASKRITAEIGRHIFYKK